MGLKEYLLASSFSGQPSLSIVKQKAENGDAKSQSIYGEMLMLGKGIAQDKFEAIIWYEKSALQGNSNGQYNLGISYFFGEGVELSYDKAVFWLMKAGKANNAKAQFVVSTCYETGHGVPKDTLTAFLWLEWSAVNGEPEAQFRLGLKFATHDAPRQVGAVAYIHKIEEVKWLKEARKNGHPKAQEVLNKLGY